MKLFSSYPNFFKYLLQIENAEFSCPSWFPVGAKSLIHKILDPNPETVSICLLMRIEIVLFYSLLSSIVMQHQFNYWKCLQPIFLIRIGILRFQHLELVWLSLF